MSNKGLAKPAEQTTVLVSGGAGFIGSHTVVELLDAGYNVVVVDNLYNSDIVAIDRIRRITGLTSDDDRPYMPLTCSIATWWSWSAA